MEKMILLTESEMGKKGCIIVKIGGLLNSNSCFVCKKKTKFIVNARCLTGNQCNCLSIGVMCSNFDVFAFCKELLHFVYFVQVSIWNAIV